MFKSNSPFDAASAVTFDRPECKSARVNRYGIGFGQTGYAGNDHFPDLETASAEWDRRVADVRKAYSTPAKGWTGKFAEELSEYPGNISAIKCARFVNIKKNGKKGRIVHTVSLYRIERTDEDIRRISELLKIPVR